MWYCCVLRGGPLGRSMYLVTDASLKRAAIRLVLTQARNHVERNISIDNPKMVQTLLLVLIIQHTHPSARQEEQDVVLPILRQQPDDRNG
jgi:hypothetical protein